MSLKSRDICQVYPRLKCGKIDYPAYVRAGVLRLFKSLCRVFEDSDARRAIWWPAGRAVYLAA